MSRKQLSKQSKRLKNIWTKAKRYIRHPEQFPTALKNRIKRRKRMAVAKTNAAVDTRIYTQKPTIPVDTNKLIDQLATLIGVIHLNKGSSITSIGVADIDLISALKFFQNHSHDPKIMIGAKHTRFDASDFNDRVFKAQSIQITLTTPSLTRETITLEAYVQQEENLWVSKNAHNATLRALRHDGLKEAGPIFAQDILGGQTLEMKSQERTIDAVYTWVNHNDPDWSAQFAQHKSTASKATDSAAMSRFHSNDELRYSLRSVATNAPWINRIFVFTNCARPDWLKPDDPRLIWVDHSEVIPGDCLPTFNSHVIESYLHHIPDLSEHFVYLNDDVFLARPLEKSFFFDLSGNSYSFLEHYGMVSGDVKVGDADYLNASRNVAALLHAGLGFVPTRLHQHTTFSLRKSVLEEIENRWPQDFARLRKNKFRTAHDINVTSFFYHHYAISQGTARIQGLRNAFVKSNHVRWREKLENAATRTFDTICINEGGTENPTSDWHEAVITFLRKKFPQKATWEN